MSTIPSETTQVRVADLRPLYEGLVTALRTAGLSGAAMNEVLARHLYVQCLQCGMQISGEDLRRLALGDVSVHDDPRLERLHQGYCARRDCGSAYYGVVVRDYPKLDWPLVLKQAIDPASIPVAAKEPADSQAAVDPAPGPSQPLDYTRLWRNPRFRLLAWIALAVTLLMAKLWISGTVPALLHRNPGFQVDPSSVDPGPVR